MINTYRLSIITNEGIFSTERLFLEGDSEISVVEDMLNLANVAESEADVLRICTTFSERYGVDTEPLSEVNIFCDALPENRERDVSEFSDWDADFTVIRNLTDDGFNFTGLLGKYPTLRLEREECLALSGGAFYAGSDEDIDRRKLLAEFESLKKNLHENNTSANYTRIQNLCGDYDDTHYDNLCLADVLGELKFMDEEILSDYIASVLVKEPTLSRIHEFVGGIYYDNLYRLSNNGNLTNIDESDFKEVIDEIQRKLLDAITPRLSRQAERKLDESYM